ncbi:hypothetical protein K7X08_016511 [Anisodus acutangulus]|uniref:C2 domain-containing protein n=1 Tax=Anisodus acutangulus TaxID=402998 RepID=A0A9Q1R0K7_9SOLA|nr:hypothetical protein K7X08_016511 [Anisodus acutangulus]
MNPYAVITCRTQEKKTSTASGEGSDPEWNENFLFTISRGCDEINIKIMDENTFGSDDYIGEATINLEEVFNQGEVPTSLYDLHKDGDQCGNIKLGLTFTREEREDEYDEDY